MFLDKLTNKLTKYHFEAYCLVIFILALELIVEGSLIFKWPNIWFNAIFWTTLGTAGITLGYHRYFSHRQFKAAPILVFALAFAASISWQGKISGWVAVHQQHHLYTDSVLDPHSPVDFSVNNKAANQISWRSFFKSHWLWQSTTAKKFLINKDISIDPIQRNIPSLLLKRLKKQQLLAIFDCDSKSLYMNAIKNDSLESFLDRIYPIFCILSFLAPILISLLIGLIANGFSTEAEDYYVDCIKSGFFWGFIVRTIIVNESTNLVNSLCHGCGYRNYPTVDNSRNINILSILTLGDSLHNNHHYDPSNPNLRRQWYEIDLSYQFLRVLDLLGLAELKKNNLHSTKTL